MNAAKALPGEMSLTRALKHCGVSRQAHRYKKRPAGRGIDAAAAGAAARIDSDRPACGMRMLADAAACGMGSPASRKKVVRMCKILDMTGPKPAKKREISTPGSPDAGGRMHSAPAAS